MRNLASIQTVDKIIEIPKANTIELVTFKNVAWQCVAKKGEFVPGGLCVYFEIDSLLPKENTAFAFMEARKFRVKTVKFMTEYLSQGLALPISAFPELDIEKMADGLDVTEVLKITKYENDAGDDEEAVEEMSKNRKKYGKFRNLLMKYKIGRFIVRTFIGNKPTGNFPTHLCAKTDETRIQNLVSLFEKAKGIEFIISEKLEGQSGTYILQKGKFFRKNTFYVCSRNNCYPTKIPNNFWYIADKYKIQEILESLMRSFKDATHITLQGEIVGPKVQKNIYKLEDLEFYAFNIVVTFKNGDVTAFNPKFIKALLEIVYEHTVKAENKITHCPILGTCILGVTPGYRTVEEILQSAEGCSTLFNTHREGLVLRNMGMHYSFKAVSNAYLLKRGY